KLTGFVCPGRWGEGTSRCTKGCIGWRGSPISTLPRAEGPCFVTLSSPLRHAVVVCVAVLAATAPLYAQGKLEARYVATLGGVSFGKGTWTIDVRDDQYTAAVSGATVGVLRIFASGQGTSAARGTVSNGQLVASSYSSTIQTDKKYDEVRMVL